MFNATSLGCITKEGSIGSDELTTKVKIILGECAVLDIKCRKCIEENGVMNCVRLR